MIDNYDGDYDDADDEPEDISCPVCHDLGGDIFNDRATPCPLCFKP